MRAIFASLQFWHAFTHPLSGRYASVEMVGFS